MLILRWWDGEAPVSWLAVALVGEHTRGLPEGSVVEAGQPYQIEIIDRVPLWRRKTND